MKITYHKYIYDWYYFIILMMKLNHANKRGEVNPIIKLDTKTNNSKKLGLRYQRLIREGRDNVKGRPDNVNPYFTKYQQ